MNKKQYTEMIRSFGCIKCGQFPAEIHHIRSMQGMSQKASDWLTVPLCKSCHTSGRDAVHQNTRDERKLLSATIEKVVNALESNSIPF